MTGSTHRGPIVFVGPQRRLPTVGATLTSLVDTTDDRPIALVTAGWEEREAEDDELRAHLSRSADNLELHRRTLDVFESDPELLAALQRCHDELSELQRLYRLQLRHLVAAARELLARAGTEELLADHRATAFENLENLDAHHLRRVERIRTRVRNDLDLAARPSLAPHREAIAAALRGASALCIAGGHVGMLYNRLWMFDVLQDLPSELPVVAWSAGAMVLASKIALFHDSPPEGPGHAELLGPGFGLFPGVLPFPHARHRLELDDVVRVQLLSRRFAGTACFAFDDGAELSFHGTGYTVGGTARQLTVDGTLACAVGGD